LSDQATTDTPKKGLPSESIVRPTILLLAGTEGRLRARRPCADRSARPLALPVSVRLDSGTLTLLGQIHKQLNAPFAQLAQDSLKVSTAALSSNKRS
jgi:hypothetical protein